LVRKVQAAQLQSILMDRDPVPLILQLAHNVVIAANQFKRASGKMPENLAQHGPFLIVITVE